MLGFSPVKSVSPATKLVMGKENWLKYVTRQKEKLETVLNVDNDKKF